MAEYGCRWTLETPLGVLEFNGTPDANGEYLRLTAVEGWDGASMRSSVEVVPQADGATVFPSYDGARFPVLAGLIVAFTPQTRTAWEDLIKAHVRAIKRADGVLRQYPTGHPPRRCRVRQYDQVAIAPSQGLQPRPFQIHLVSGDPAIVSDIELAVDTTGLQPGQGSWGFPFAFAFAFGDTASGGTATVQAGGNAPTYPTIRVYGQATSPRVANLTTGESLSLSALSLAAGDFAEIDTAAKTVTLNGSSLHSLIGALDIPTSTFWALQPGPNTIQLTASQFAAGAYAEIRWRDGWA
jgi:hypothetical protein